MGSGQQRDFTKQEFYVGMSDFYHGSDVKKHGSICKRVAEGTGKLETKYGIKGEELRSSPERRKAAPYQLGYKDPVAFYDKFLAHEEQQELGEHEE